MDSPRILELFNSGEVVTESYDWPLIASGQRGSIHIQEELCQSCRSDVVLCFFEVFWPMCEVIIGPAMRRLFENRAETYHPSLESEIPSTLKCKLSSYQENSGTIQTALLRSEPGIST